MSPQTDAERELAELLVESLNLDDIPAASIDPEAPLFNTGLGLDSIDALEIVVMLESEFGIKVKNETSARDSFRSISTLANYVEAKLGQEQPQA